MKTFNVFIIMIMIIIIIIIFFLPKVFMTLRCQTLIRNVYSGVAILLQIRSNKRALKSNCIKTLDHDRQILEQKALLDRQKFGLEDDPGRREKLLP